MLCITQWNNMKDVRLCMSCLGFIYLYFVWFGRFVFSPPEYKYHIMAEETISHCEAFTDIYKLITHVQIICLNMSTKVVCCTEGVDHIEKIHPLPCISLDFCCCFCFLVNSTTILLWKTLCLACFWDMKRSHSNVALMLLLMLCLPLVTIYNRTYCDFIHPSITQAFTISSAC